MFTALPQGMNSSAFLHNIVFSQVIGEFYNLKPSATTQLSYYLDDAILSMGDDWTNNIRDLEIFFRVLDKYSITLNPKKLQLLKPSVTYLGFQLEANHFSPSDHKIEEIQMLGNPKTRKELKSVLGFLAYFRNFVPAFSTLSSPIYKECSRPSNEPYSFSGKVKANFYKIKEILQAKPLLYTPSPKYQNLLYMFRQLRHSNGRNVGSFRKTFCAGEINLSS